jgi:hypothetical protein
LPWATRHLARCGTPQIFNTVLGSQFTSDALTSLTTPRGPPVSMGGKDRWRDDVFVERLWKSAEPTRGLRDHKSGQGISDSLLHFHDE